MSRVTKRARSAPFSTFSPKVCEKLGALQAGETVRLRVNLAHFYNVTVKGHAGAGGPGSEVLRDLYFTPSLVLGRDANGVGWVGRGRIDESDIPGLCWTMTDAAKKIVRVGIGFSLHDIRKPVGEPGMLENQWLGATSDDVRDCAPA